MVAPRISIPIGPSSPFLPPELLAAIFIEGLPKGRHVNERDRYIRTLMDTCSFWRNVVLGIRSLWTQLPIDLARCSDKRYLDHIAAQAERSGRHTLDLILSRPLLGMLSPNPKPREAAEPLDQLASVLDDARFRVETYTLIAEPINAGVVTLPLNPSLFPALRSLCFEGKESTTNNAHQHQTSTISAVELLAVDSKINLASLASLTFKSLHHSLNFSSIPSAHLSTISYLVRAGRRELLQLSAFVRSCPVLTSAYILAQPQTTRTVCWKRLAIHSESLETLYIDMGSGVCHIQPLFAPNLRVLHLVNVGAGSGMENLQYDAESWSLHSLTELAVFVRKRNWSSPKLLFNILEVATRLEKISLSGATFGPLMDHLVCAVESDDDDDDDDEDDGEDDERSSERNSDGEAEGDPCIIGDASTGDAKKNDPDLSTDIEYAQPKRLPPSRAPSPTPRACTPKPSRHIALQQGAAQTGVPPKVSTHRASSPIAPSPRTCPVKRHPSAYDTDGEHLENHNLHGIDTMPNDFLNVTEKQWKRWIDPTRAAPVLPALRLVELFSSKHNADDRLEIIQDLMMQRLDLRIKLYNWWPSPPEDISAGHV